MSCKNIDLPSNMDAIKKISIRNHIGRAIENTKLINSLNDLAFYPLKYLGKESIYLSNFVKKQVNLGLENIY